MTVKGKVFRLETYGAFVDFGAERPGMVHVSELTRGYVKTPGEVVKEGDEIEAKVLEVNRKKKQIRLSMKALMPEIVEEEKPVREPKKERGGERGSERGGDRGGERGGKRGKKREETYETFSETPKEPEQTAMQIAWQMAMDRAKTKDKTVKVKSVKSSSEQEDILSRTLEKRLPTGG